MTSPDGIDDQAVAAGGGHGQPPVADARRGMRLTRVGSVWVALVLFAIVLLVLLVFILQNGGQADIAFFGAHWHLPLGVALLLAAVFGNLLVLIPGTARILQLRAAARRREGIAGRPSPLLTRSRRSSAG
jgi:uncharacterized integral membrane protein